MLINDLIGMLMNMPTPLAVGWGVWFVVGLGLSVWSRREKARLVMHGYDEPAPTPRPKSGPRPSVRPAVKPVAVPHTVPQSAGNPFGDLEALFNEVQEGSHRTPGEAPSAAPPPAPSVNEPLRSAPVLAAPQSLP
jgi:hypothetical protein